ncbi:MAG: anhydro-N-acetylmuramic acid kinase [Deltaproteobacteria bacterium]|nr:anhydro-N-acetylmuramic acid kinase [Deltaproteobacteria bacterium]
MDSITSALCDIDENNVSLIDYKNFNFSTKTKVLLQNCLNLKTQEISELNFLIGRDFARALKTHITNLKTRIDLCGFHGQTVFHHSGLSRVKSSLQLGVPEYIAEKAKCFVVSDFRVRDIVCGGEGAPLSPWGDLRIFSVNEPFCVLNLGGIANYTYIDRKREIILGFDTGPGNCLIDKTVKFFRLAEENFDRNGHLGQKGSVDRKLLSFMLSLDDYFSLKPPKSCGLERFGDNFIRICRKKFPNINELNFLRTIYEYTLIGIKAGLRFLPKFNLLIICGGGSQNHFLINLLREGLKKQIALSDDFGVPWHAREAMIFAVLAYDFIMGLPTNVPAVTGAKKRRLLGRLVFP